MVSHSFCAALVAEPPPLERKNVSPLNKFLNTPLPELQLFKKKTKSLNCFVNFKSAFNMEKGKFYFQFFYYKIKSKIDELLIN